MTDKSYRIQLRLEKSNLILQIKWLLNKVKPLLKAKTWQFIRIVEFGKIQTGFSHLSIPITG